MTPELAAFVLAGLSAGRAWSLWVTSVVTGDLCEPDLVAEFKRQAEHAFAAYAELKRARSI